MLWSQNCRPKLILVDQRTIVTHQSFKVPITSQKKYPGKLTDKKRPSQDYQFLKMALLIC